MSARLDLKVPAPVVAALLALVMWLISPVSPALPFTEPWQSRVFELFSGIGIAFDVIGMLTFLRSRTTINPLKPERASTLVTDGVFRLTRNPMYLGLVLVLTGWAVHLGTVWPFFGPVLFLIYVDRFQIEPEERALSERFGQEFLDYTARVRRWL